MTGSNILLDSNVIIELFKGNPAVIVKFQSLSSVNVSFTVLGELYFGAYRSSNITKHLKQINNFQNLCTVFTGNDATANQYAQIKTMLLKKGKPIPENDIWIAAIASQYDFTLATRDNHFDEIASLSTVYW